MKSLLLVGFLSLSSVQADQYAEFRKLGKKERTELTKPSKNPTSPPLYVVGEIAEREETGDQVIIVDVKWDGYGWVYSVVLAPTK